MASRETYIARLMSEGKTKRERGLNRLKQSIQSSVKDLLSYHEVLINGVKVGITAESTEKASVKKFTAAPNEHIGYGDYVLWDGIHWIVSERDYDDDVYIRGKITQCNYFLKWQNEKNEIVGRWAVIETVTRYNNGVFEGKFIDNIQSTISAMIGCDDETMKLKRDFRFLADIYSEEPYAFKITQRDVLSKYYGDSGLITWALTQEGFNSETDNTELMIADYRKPAEESTITGADIIYIGRSASYTSPLTSPNWTLIDAPIDWIVSKNQSCDIMIPVDLSLAGKSITLSDGTNEKKITIKALL